MRHPKNYGFPWIIHPSVTKLSQINYMSEWPLLYLYLPYVTITVEYFVHQMVHNWLHSLISLFHRVNLWLFFTFWRFCFCVWYLVVKWIRLTLLFYSPSFWLAINRDFIRCLPPRSPSFCMKRTNRKPWNEPCTKIGTLHIHFKKNLKNIENYQRYTRLNQRNNR